MSETWEQLLAKSKGPWHTPAPERRASASEQDTGVGSDMRPVFNVESTMDADIAQAFAAIHSDKLRYVPEAKAWTFWDHSKARWVLDPAGDVAAQHRLKQWMHRLSQDASERAFRGALAKGESQEDAAEKAHNVEKGLKSTSKLMAVWTQVKSEPRLITTLRHFDSDPWLLNTPTGPIDLWTGEASAPDPKFLCFKQTAVAPADGPTPLWDKVLGDAFPHDEDTQAYVETILGLSLIGDQSIQHFFMLSGEAGSGKGTLMNTFMSLMGTGDTGYAMPVEAEFLMQQKSDKHPEQYARLKGKRLVVSSESSRKQAFDAARVKNLTGDDIQTGRFMRGNSFSFKPSWTLCLMTNYRPRVDPEDGGFWRRFREVPFRHKPVEPIANLQARLIEEEGPQILARAIRRLMTFIAEGGMWTPTAVQHATLENKAEQDTVAEFISEMCELSDEDGVFATASSLFESYVKWSKLNGYDALTSQALGYRLSALGLEKDRAKVFGKTVVVRRGVRLVQESGGY